MKYKVKVYCTDCTGYDDLGCNCGEPWYIENETGCLEFDTYEEADEVGKKETADCAPWEYEVIELE